MSGFLALNCLKCRKYIFCRNHFVSLILWTDFVSNFPIHYRLLSCNTLGKKKQDVHESLYVSIAHNVVINFLCLVIWRSKQRKSRWCSVLRCHRTFPQGWKAKRRDDKLCFLRQSRRMKPQWQINKWVSAFTCACFHPCHTVAWEGEREVRLSAHYSSDLWQDLCCIFWVVELHHP